MKRALLVVGIVGLGVGALTAALLATSPPRRPPGHEAPLPIASPAQGPLAGLVVYLSAGHGWLLHRVHHDGEPIAWGRQRELQHGMVEDDWTAGFVTYHLAPELEAAGATVLALRERDRNPSMAVADDAEPAFHVEEAHEVRSDPLALNGMHTVVDPRGTALWWLEVPEDGQWYVYARWAAAADHESSAVYVVRAGTETREVVVDQRAHGGHWWPLGDLCLPAGTLVEVELHGAGSAMLSADAVRLGGGTSRVVPTFDYEVRSHPMWQVAMPHQVEHLGAPAEFGEYECGNPVSDMRLRPRWASWASPEGEDAVYLSIHTNANPWGAVQGLTVFAGVDSSPATPVSPRSLALATALERSVFEAVRSRDAGYRTRGVELGDFSEISPVHNRLPSALLELGFHDNPADARRLQTDRFRDDAARGIVQGLLRWRGAPASTVPNP